MTWREELRRLQRLLLRHHRELRGEEGAKVGAQWVEIAAGALGDALQDLPRETLRKPVPSDHTEPVTSAEAERPPVAAPVSAVAAKRARHCRYCGGADHDARRCPLPYCGEILENAAKCSTVGCRIHSNGARLEGLDREPETAPPPDAAPASDGEEDPEPAPSPVQARLRSKLRVLQDGARVRAKTVSSRKLSRAEKEYGAALEYPDDVERPQARHECLAMERPCPFVSCSHHLYLDVNPETGSIKVNFPHLEVWEMRESCSLDVADRGGITLEEVGAILNLTRERIRQVEVRGLARIKDHAGDDLGLPPEAP